MDSSTPSRTTVTACSSATLDTMRGYLRESQRNKAWVQGTWRESRRAAGQPPGGEVKDARGHPSFTVFSCSCVCCGVVLAVVGAVQGAGGCQCVFVRVGRCSPHQFLGSVPDLARQELSVRQPPLSRVLSRRDTHTRRSECPLPCA